MQKPGAPCKRVLFRKPLLNFPQHALLLGNLGRRPCRQVCARGQSPGDDPRSSFNPFKKKSSKEEEAARRTLEGMFKGQKDVLAAYDTDGGKGGGPGGRGLGSGGGGGGGGGGWEPPNWRQWGDGFGKRVGGVLKVLGALLLFVSAFVVVPMIPEILAGALGLVKWVLRLEGRAGVRRRPPANDAVQLAGSDNLGQREQSVIAKYGGDIDLLEGADADVEDSEEED